MAEEVDDEGCSMFGILALLYIIVACYCNMLLIPDIDDASKVIGRFMLSAIWPFTMFFLLIEYLINR